MKSISFLHFYFFLYFLPDNHKVTTAVILISNNAIAVPATDGSPVFGEASGLSVAVVPTVAVVAVAVTTDATAYSENLSE